MNCNVDGELWIRLVKGKKKKHIKFPLGTIRQQPHAKSHSETSIDKWKEDDIHINALHGVPPHPKAFVSYEYRLVQKIFKLF